MTKEEKIQEVLLNHSIHADSNAWIKLGIYTPNDLGFLEHEIQRNENIGIWRPKSLQGIENNNNWIKIESEDDLPKERCFCWVLEKEIGIVAGEYLNNSKEERFFWFDNATHYQLIKKPKP